MDGLTIGLLGVAVLAAFTFLTTRTRASKKGRDSYSGSDAGDGMSYWPASDSGSSDHQTSDCSDSGGGDGGGDSGCDSGGGGDGGAGGSD